MKAHCTKLLPVLVIALGIPLTGTADLRPLSRAMLGNLQATNSIGESLAVGDYGAVAAAAEDLRNRARKIRGWKVDDLGFNPAGKAEFDAYLKLQEEISDKIMRSARREDSRSIVDGLGELMTKACLSCHKNFRDRQGMLKSSTLFMTSFVSSWREMNRGLLLNDYSLVARGARSLGSMGRVMSWDPIIESSFGLSKAANREKFRKYLHKLIGHADKVEEAATRGESQLIQQSITAMWNDGCIACHGEFR